MRPRAPALGATREAGQEKQFATRADARSMPIEALRRAVGK